MADRTGVTTLAGLLRTASGHINTPIVLAGRDSELLADTVAGTGVRVAGTVTDGELAELRAGARAMLIHQRFGTGALTRIPESLVAGVPVICNGVAARSAYQYDGVYTFETASELAGLLDRDLPTPPVPPRPEAAEKRFIAAVRKVVGLPLA